MMGEKGKRKSGMSGRRKGRGEGNLSNDFTFPFVQLSYLLLLLLLLLHRQSGLVDPTGGPLVGPVQNSMPEFT